MQVHAPDASEDDEAGGGLDPALALGALGFCLRAVRVRRAWVVAGLALGLGAASLLWWALPRRYRVETKLLAQSSQAIAVLGNPSRPLPLESDPTRSAGDLVTRRQSLEALVRQTNLVEHMRASQSPAGRLRDWLLHFVLPEPTDEQRREMAVLTLEKRLFAFSSEGKVTIGVIWNDPEMAVRLVQTATQNFLETRRVTETSIINESILLLEGRLDGARKAVEDAVAEARRIGARSPRPAPRALAAEERAEPTPEESEHERELARLRTQITTRQRAIADLEEFRRRRTSELQAQLVEQRAIYAESHPVVVNLEQGLAALGQDSPQLAALRGEVRELETEYTAKGGPPLDESAAASRGATPALVVTSDTALLRDPAEDYGQSRLRAAITRYSSLLDRVEAARMELDASQAAFKYRYLVLKPAEHPRRPYFPKASLIFGGGLLAGVCMGLLAAVWLEWRRGLILQEWQLERLLGVPILARLPR